MSNFYCTNFTETKINVRYNEQLDPLYHRIMQHFLCILASYADYPLLGFVTRWGGLRDQQKEHIPAFVLTTAYFDTQKYIQTFIKRPIGFHLWTSAVYNFHQHNSKGKNIDLDAVDDLLSLFC